MKTRSEVSAGGVLLREGADGSEVVLASRRTRRGDLVWGLPKGQVEQGESPEETAVREVREETGFDGEIREPLGTVRYFYVWEGIRVRKTVHFFLMRHTGGDPSLRDHEMEEVAWFPIAEAPKVAGFDSERDILRKAADRGA